MSTDIAKIQQEITTQLANKEVLKALVATTFKGLSEVIVPQAMLEGMIRGYTFKDFLEKNIYAVKFGPGYSLVTSIDHNRKIGMASGIVGTDEPIYEMTDEKTASGIPKPLSAKVTVHRMIDGHVGAFTGKVYFDEYYKEGSTWEGKYKPSMWDAKPRTMLAKVAEMHALRKACPEKLSQAYVEEERAAEVIHVVPELTSHKAKLEAVTNLTELKAVWDSLPVEAKNELEGIKNELKKKYETA